MQNLWKMSLILLVVCSIAAGSLAFVYKVTKSRIEKQKESEKMEALEEVMPDATRFDTDTVPNRWVAYKGEQKIGLAIETSVQGYSGPIRLIIGVDKNKKITKVRIIEQNETPGLGAKIKEKNFLNQFKGKCEFEIILKKDNPQNGKIDAISGATISSRAVTNAIREAMKSVK